MRLIDRILRPLDRLVGLDQLKEAVSRQDAEAKALTAQHVKVRQILLDALRWDDVSHYHCPTLADLAGKVKWYFDQERESNEAKDVEIVRLTRDLDRCRRMCDGRQAQVDELQQANVRLTTEAEDARHVIDQCEADRNALAKERDQAISDRNMLSEAVDVARVERNAARADVGHRSQVAAQLQHNCGEHERRVADLRARISNAVDQLTGPREFAETKPVETLDSPADAPTALDRMGPQWIKRWDTTV